MSRGSSVPLARGAGELTGDVLPTQILELTRPEQSVGNRRDLLGIAPSLLELEQLTLHRAAFGVLVRRHLERQAVHERQAQHQRTGLAGNRAATPERSVGDV